MIIVMNKNVTEAQIGNIVKKAQDLGHEINLQDAVINMCGIPAGGNQIQIIGLSF